MFLEGEAISVVNEFVKKYKDWEISYLNTDENILILENEKKGITLDFREDDKEKLIINDYKRLDFVVTFEFAPKRLSNYFKSKEKLSEFIETAVKVSDELVKLQSKILRYREGD